MLLVKNLPAGAGDTGHVGSVPGSGRSSWGGHGNPLQYPSLENPMDRGAWWSTVHRVAKSQTRLKQLSIHTHTYFFKVRIKECMCEHDLMLLYYLCSSSISKNLAGYNLSPVFLFFDSTGWLDCNFHCFNGGFHLPRRPNSWTLHTQGKWGKIRSMI